MKSPFYNLKTKKFSNPIKFGLSSVYAKMGLIQTAILLKQLFFDRKYRAPKHKLPEVVPDIDSFFNSKNKFIWLGHSTVLINVDGKNILFDPVFSDYAFPVDLFVKRFQASLLQPKDLDKIDFIVISHNHYDHLDQKTIKLFKNHNLKFITPLRVGKYLVKWGIDRNKIIELDWGENYKVDDVNFVCTPALHGSGRSYLDRDKSLWSSWVLQSPENHIFFSGDSGYGTHFKEIGEAYGPFDLTFIENGQYDEKWREIHLNPSEAVKAHQDLRGKYLVPIHWAMFDLGLHFWSDPIVEIFKIAKKENINLVTPLIGELISICDEKNCEQWWDFRTPLPHSPEEHRASLH